MKLLKNNKQIGAIQSFIWGIITIGVLIAVGMLILTDLKSSADTNSYMCPGGTQNYGSYNATSDTCYNSTAHTIAAVHSTAYNSTGTLITKLATAPTWIGILIVVAFASAVLAYFYMQGRR